jgi:hypothetical protein
MGLPPAIDAGLLRDRVAAPGYGPALPTGSRAVPDDPTSSPRHPDDGVRWVRDGQRRSTTRGGKRILAAAASVVDPDLAVAIEHEQNWRKGYAEHFRALVRAETLRPDLATGVPKAGLDAVRRQFVMVRDGEETALGDAMVAPRGELVTVEVRGEGASRPALEVPVGGRVLSGGDLDAQLQDWVARGTVEPSFATAVARVVANPDWLDLSDRTIALLGAGAEMGPLEHLAAWGARLVPVDLPGARVWGRILDAVRSGTGVAQVPVRHRVDADDLDAVAAGAGADLLTEAPEVAHWLAGSDGPLTVGNHVYLDGGDYVRVSVAVDAIVERLLASRDDLSSAVLATPTDVFAAPPDAVAAAQDAFGRDSLAHRLVRAVSLGRGFAPNYARTLAVGGVGFGLADSIVVQQGPNYLLAKRLHQWRARQARQDGLVSSANVAPPTRTVSVTKNRVLAAAYDGAGRYGVEIFAPETSRALMAALLVHDLRCPDAVARPEHTLDHPLRLFMDGANHGGLWRVPWASRTVLPLAAARGLSPVPLP